MRKSNVIDLTPEQVEEITAHLAAKYSSSQYTVKPSQVASFDVFRMEVYSAHSGARLREHDFNVQITRNGDGWITGSF
jgi:hypothetical protein